MAAACAAYAAGAYLSGALTLPPNTLASLRPPNALILAAAVLAPPARWWLYPLATIPGNPALFDRGVSWASALGYTAANMAEVGLGLAMISAGAAARAALQPADRLRSVPRRRRGPRAGRVGRHRRGDRLRAAPGLRLLADLADLDAGRCPLAHRAGAADRPLFAPGMVAPNRAARRSRTPRRGTAGGDLAGAHRYLRRRVTVSGARVRAAAVPCLGGRAPRRRRARARAAVVSGVVLGAALSRAGAFAGLSSSDAALSMQLLLLMMARAADASRGNGRRTARGRSAVHDAVPRDARHHLLTSWRDGRIIEVNESFERLTGFTRGQAIGRTAVELGSDADPGLRATR